MRSLITERRKLLNNQFPSIDMRRLFYMASAAVIITIVLFTLVYPYSPAGRQGANLKTIERHLPSVIASIDSDERFDRIEAGRYTGGGGQFFIYGSVDSEASMQALHDRIESLNLPLGVAYRVEIEHSPQ